MYITAANFELQSSVHRKRWKRPSESMSAEYQRVNSSLVSYVESSFDVVDYIIFVALLCVSGGVGVYFHCRGHKNTNEYFFGGRNMGTLSTGISYALSFLSTLSLVGIPSEIYINGVQYVIAIFSSSITFALGGALIATVIYPLEFMTLNEYFRHRYKSKALTFTANLMVVLVTLHYMGACMLGSVVALKSATGGEVNIIKGILIAGSVGTFYTSIGGLKAVVWSDVVQFLVMLFGVIAILVKSVLDTPGGMSTIWEMNQKYQRIDSFSWSPDPTVRHTVWGLALGKGLSALTWPIQPAGVQRLCSTKTRRDSFKVAAISGILFLVFTGLPALIGFNVFGYYSSQGCDVFAAKWVTGNEIVPYFVRDRLPYPGFQGFFIATLFSASLSSFSSGLSASSVIIWRDMIKPMLKGEVNELKATFLSKLIVVVFGVLSMIWCFVLHTFGGLILQISGSFGGSLYAAYFGLFAFAIFFRFGTYLGGLLGTVIGFVVTFSIGFSSLIYGQTHSAGLPTVTDQCFDNDSFTGIILPSSTAAISLDNDQQSFNFFIWLLSISYIWLPCITLVVFSFVAASVTFCTGPMPKDQLDVNLLFPSCRPNLRKDAKSYQYERAEACENFVEDGYAMKEF